MTYRKLAENPTDGVYRVAGTNTHVIVDGARIIHSPSGRAIEDDAELEEI